MNHYFATPLTFPRDAVTQTVGYLCPLCGAELAGGPDPGWVRCPLVEGRFICLGCCIDEQASARRGTSNSGRAAVCLAHQLELLSAELPNTDNAAALREIRELVADR